MPSLIKIDGDLDFGDRVLIFFDSWMDASNFLEDEYKIGCSTGNCKFYHIKEDIKRNEDNYLFQPAIELSLETKNE